MPAVHVQLSIFLSTLSLRRATRNKPILHSPVSLFLSTLSLRRATVACCVICNGPDNFYPRSPCGERRGLLRHMQRARYFYPRSPCGERHHYIRILCRPRHYFYPRSPCGERPRCLLFIQNSGNISIHALLAESDLSFATMSLRSRLFLSTHSLRRATSPLCCTIAGVNISIHALLAESDDSLQRSCERVHISIHALLAESDQSHSTGHTPNAYFYPRSPCGERQYQGSRYSTCGKFLSTLSLRRATGLRNIDQLQIHISIHALLAESDQ